MAWFRRGRSPGNGRTARSTYRPETDHLEAFVRSRRGVEAFIEPRTTVTETTVLLIAHDGEWTRRRIGSPGQARAWAYRMAIPIYDVALVGYPQRMRDYNARRRGSG